MEQHNPPSEREVLESEFDDLLKLLPSLKEREEALELLSVNKERAIRTTDISEKKLGTAVVDAIRKTVESVRKTVESLKQGDKS